MASLAKSTIGAALRQLGVAGGSPTTLVDALKELVDGLNQDLGEQKVVCAVFHALVNTARGALTYAVAGPVRTCVRMRDGFVHDIPADTPALGSPTPVRQEVGSFELNLIDRLLISTQGMCDATSASGESFGSSRSAHLLGETAVMPLDGQLSAVFEAIHAHLGSASTLPEDVTIFLAEFGQHPQTARSEPVMHLFNAFERLSDPTVDSSVFLG